MKKARDGFTMVELLIVIGIVAFLAAILAVAVTPFLANAKRRATEATLLKVDQMLSKRIEAVRRVADEAQTKFSSTPWQRKNIMRQQFPQNFLELCGVDLAPGVKGKDDDGNGISDFDASGNPDIAEIGWPQSDDTYSPVAIALYTQLNGSPKRPSAYKQHAGTNRTTESSELLYLILTSARIYGIAPVDADQFSSREVVDADGDGLPEIVDGWGHPFRFYRWPTRVLRPAPAGSESTPQSVNGSGYAYWIQAGTQIVTDKDGNKIGYPTPALLLFGSLPPTGSAASRLKGATLAQEAQDPLAVDPDDPKQLFLNNYSYAQTAAMESAFHTRDTYHVPLLVSAGADGVLGLYEPTDIAHFGHLAQPIMDDPTFSDLTDNVTNVTLKAGGQ